MVSQMTESDPLPVQELMLPVSVLEDLENHESEPLLGSDAQVKINVVPISQNKNVVFKENLVDVLYVASENEELHNVKAESSNLVEIEKKYSDISDEELEPNHVERLQSCISTDSGCECDFYEQSDSAQPKSSKQEENPSQACDKYIIVESCNNCGSRNPVLHKCDAGTQVSVEESQSFQTDRTRDTENECIFNEKPRQKNDSGVHCESLCDKDDNNLSVIPNCSVVQNPCVSSVSCQSHPSSSDDITDTGEDVETR